MNAITKPVQKAASWAYDDALGMKPGSESTPWGDAGGAPNDGGVGLSAGGVGGGTGGVPEPMGASPAGAPMIQNIIQSPPPAPPPAFGSAPDGGKPAKKNLPSTFLGANALPAKKKAPGGFGFDTQQPGQKTLIGQ